MMGGYSLEDDLEYSFALAGNKGDGKSATCKKSLMYVGPEVLEVFDLKPCSFDVTNNFYLRKIIITDDQFVNVVDTPVLSDSSLDSESIGMEIVRCINMGTLGVDAFVVVFPISSSCGSFEKEKGVISRLVTLFGRRIYEYMIIVFTGGDELESQGKTLEDFLHDSPEALKEILSRCGSRCVLFDNTTKNQTKKGEQVQQLLRLVNMVIEKNGGQPYNHLMEMYAEYKSRAQEEMSLEVTRQENQSRLIEKIKQKTEMFESMLEQALKNERDARLATEEAAKIEQKRSNEDIEKRFKEQFKQKTEMFESILEQALGKESDARLAIEEAAKVEQARSNEEIEKLRDSLDTMQLNLAILFLLIVVFFVVGTNFGFKVIRYFL